MPADLIQSSGKLDMEPDFTKYIMINTIQIFTFLAPCHYRRPLLLSQKQLIIESMQHRCGGEQDQGLLQPSLSQPFGCGFRMSQQGIEKALAHIKCIQECVLPLSAQPFLTIQAAFFYRFKVSVIKCHTHRKKIAIQHNAELFFLLCRRHGHAVGNVGIGQLSSLIEQVSRKAMLRTVAVSVRDLIIIGHTLLHLGIFAVCAAYTAMVHHKNRWRGKCPSAFGVNTE